MKNKIIKAGIGYTIGNYLIKGLSFLTIPIFVRLMTVEDYGLYSVYLSYESVLCIILGLALHTSFKNAKLKYKTKFNQYISTCIIIAIINFFFWIFFLNIFFIFLKNVVPFPRMIINLLILHSFSSAIIQYYNTYLSLEYEYRPFLIIALFNAVSSIVLSICLILCYTNNTFYARVYGVVLPIIIISLYIIVYFFKKNICFSKSFCHFGLSYSIPIIPHGISQIILSQFDRIMINQMIGATSAGLYSFAYNIFSILQVTFSSLGSVWSPWVFNKLYAKEYKKIRQVANMYIFFIFFLCIILIIISPEIISIIGTNEYIDSNKAIFPIVSGGFFAFLYTIPCEIEYFYEKTKMIGIGTTFAAILNIILNYYAIKYFGYIGAAYTTLITYIIYFMFHYLNSKKIMGFFLFDTKFIVILSITLLITGTIILNIINYTLLRYTILFIFFIITVIIILKNKEEILDVYKR